MSFFYGPFGASMNTTPGSAGPAGPPGVDGAQGAQGATGAVNNAEAGSGTYSPTVTVQFLDPAPTITVNWAAYHRIDSIVKLNGTITVDYTSITNPSGVIMNLPVPNSWTVDTSGTPTVFGYCLVDSDTASSQNCKPVNYSGIVNAANANYVELEISAPSSTFSNNTILFQYHITYVTDA